MGKAVTSLTSRFAKSTEVANKVRNGSSNSSSETRMFAMQMLKATLWIYYKQETLQSMKKLWKKRKGHNSPRTVLVLQTVKAMLLQSVRSTYKYLRYPSAANVAPQIHMEIQYIPARLGDLAMSVINMGVKNMQTEHLRH